LKAKDYAGLAQLPRDASPTRVKIVAKSPAAAALHSPLQSFASDFSRARFPGIDPWRDEIKLVELAVVCDVRWKSATAVQRRCPFFISQRSLLMRS
jgi:hypothetical protein